MDDFYPLHLPEDKTPGHCLATFSTAITAMAIELGTFINGNMTTKHGAGWFNQIEQARADANPKYRKSRSCFDFSWIVNEPYHHSDSLIREYLPRNKPLFYRDLKQLLETRNEWYHDYNPHNIKSLIKALIVIQRLAKECNLLMADHLEEILERARAIDANSYKPFATPAKQVVAQEPDGEPQLGAQVVPQVAVGASWLGPIGSRKIELKKSGALIDPVVAANVAGELTQEQTQRYLKLWIALDPGWLWINELGEVAAHVEGVLRMVGYWGEKANDSKQDPFAKFRLPYSYEFDEEGFRIIDKRTLLAEKNIGEVTRSTLKRGREMVGNNEILRVTWDGDLIYFGDAGAEYIGEVESKDWFLGHFLVPTHE